MPSEAEKLAMALLTGSVKAMPQFAVDPQVEDSLFYDVDPYAEWGPLAGGIEPTLPLLADITPIGDADAMIQGAADRDPLALALAALSLGVPGTIKIKNGGLDELLDRELASIKRHPIETAAHRFTEENKGPMSDWGHAMFANNLDQVYHYGPDHWIVDAGEAVRSEDLERPFRIAMLKRMQEGYFNPKDFGPGITTKDLARTVSPSRIADTAEAYDSGVLAQFLWDEILEPADIKIIDTPDGRIVYDEALIKKGEPYEW